MKRKLGIICECLRGTQSFDTLDYIKNAGFESVFTGHYNLPFAEKLKNKADKLGLEMEFIHSPFSGINNMWREGDAYKELYGKITESVDTAKALGINAVVLHVSSGWHCPEINDLGLSRFDALVDYADKNGVTVAFENLRKVGNIAYFFDRYEKRENVRYCYDCGHEHCYTETVCFPDIFKDKMIFTHLHDNFGRDKNDLEADGDIHLLPFDGNLDFAKMVAKLDEYNYCGSLMLEVNDSKYEIKDEDFVKEAYKRAVKIAELSK